MIPPFLRRRWGAGLDPDLEDVIGGTSTAFVLRLLSRGLTLVFHLVLARLLGAEGAGVYFLALSASAVGSVVGAVGLPNAMVRFSAVHAAQKEWDRIAGLYRHGMWMAGLASAVVTLTVFGAAPALARDVFSEPALTVPLRLMALTILPTTLLHLHAELLRGLQRIGDALLAELVAVPLCSLLFLVVIGAAWQATGAAVAYLAGTLLSLGWGVWLWRRATPQVRAAKQDFDLRLLLRSSSPLFVVGLTGLVMSWTGTFLLGVWQDSQAVGLYGIGMRVSTVISSMLVVLNTAVAPKFAALYAQQALTDLRRLVRRATLLGTVFALPLALLFWFFPRPVLGLFGAEFRAAALVLVILTVGQFVNVAVGSVGTLLVMSGHEKEYRNMAIGSAGLNLLLSVALIPPYGIEGAAVASAASVVLMNLGCLLQVHRRLGIINDPVGFGASR